MTNLIPFNFEHQEVRVMQNGKTMFVAADVCKVLEIANNRDALSRLDDDEKGVGLTDTPSGKQEMLGVTESGLYCLILRSRKAVTPGTIQHRFRKWVTSELLPAVRKGQVQTTAKPDSRSVVNDTLKEMQDNRKHWQSDFTNAELRMQLTQAEARQHILMQQINMLEHRAGFYQRNLEKAHTKIKGYEILHGRVREALKEEPAAQQLHLLEA